jgi:hypothetical protein
MSRNPKQEEVTIAAATGALLDITWSSNTPTAGNTQTIADGDLVAGTELGLAIQNLNTILTAVIADVASIKTKLNGT